MAEARGIRNRGFLMMNKEPEFWGMEKDACITWTSIEKRIEDYLETCVRDKVKPKKTSTKIEKKPKKKAATMLRLCSPFRT